ncbi:MAG: type II secretion system F family protein [Planctomycetota bacterium]|jgi:tight adherence protein B
MNPAEIINIIIIVTVFVLVFSIWGLCVFLWLGQYLLRLKAIQKRLGIVGRESGETKTLRLWREVQKESDTAFKEEKLSFNERLESLRKEAGWHAPAQMVFVGVFGLIILSFVVTYIISGSFLISAVAPMAVVFVFTSYTNNKLRKREEMMERQLIDALGIASRALRAGHPLVGAFQLVSEEIRDPLGGMFYRICKEQELGVDLKDSMYKVARLSHNSEMKLLATAVVIQFQSGGNFADLMDSLSAVIRARIRLNRRVRIITAQTQFSKKILVALPIVLLVILNIMNPSYMEPMFTTPRGQFMLAMMFILMLLGWWVMNKMSVIRF